MQAPITTTPQSKPSKVQMIGVLMIISGAVNISMGLGLLVGLALSVILICCAPVGALPLALGIFEIVNGIRLISSGQEPVDPQTLQTIAILEVVTILGSNAVSFIIGIVNLVLLSDNEVTAYFRASGGKG
jgi:hypothetical protein